MNRQQALRIALLVDCLPILLLLSFSIFFTEQTLANPTEEFRNYYGELITIFYLDQPEFGRALFGTYVLGSATLAATILYLVSLHQGSHSAVVLFTLKTILLLATAHWTKDAIPLNFFLGFILFAIGTSLFFAIALFHPERRYWASGIALAA
jgi:hypothetical protein